MKDGTLISQVAEQMLLAGMSIEEGVRAIRKELIAAALRQNNGNAVRTARALGIHRNTLSRQMDELHIWSLAREIRAELRLARDLARRQGTLDLGRRKQSALGNQPEQSNAKVA